MNSKTNWDAVQRDESQKAHAAEVAGLKQELDIAKQSLERHRNARKVRAPMVREARKRGAGDVVRVVIPDTHGALVDKGALAALLGDVKALDPHEIILLGDHVDCGGFLAQHHVMGYVAETDYTYEEDIAAANPFLDALQKAAPRAKIEYIEGNHERARGDVVRDPDAPKQEGRRRTAAASLPGIPTQPRRARDSVFQARRLL